MPDPAASSAIAARARALPGGSRRGSGVPGRIRLLTGVTIAALALLFATLAVTTQSARTGLQVIGHDAGPQVLATAGLYHALSDMDGQVALVLLLGNEHADRRRQALERYAARRTEAGRALLRASALAGDDAAEGRTIQAVLDGLGRYEQLASRAMLLDEQARHAAGSPPENVLEVYRQATDLMRAELLPQAYNLTLESGTIVRRTHDEARASMGAGRFVVAVGCVLALGSLVVLQGYLTRRFRRLVAPALVVATAITAIYAYAGVVVLGRESDALLTAKRDGFDSVLALARARAISGDMHGDQTRYLIDPERADTYEHTYLDAARAVLYLEAVNVPSYHGQAANAAATAPPPGGYPGLLGTALARGTPERAVEALRVYDGVQRADAELRRLAASDRDEEAVAVRLGAVDAASAAYDDLLGRLAEERRAVFQRAIADGEAGMADLWFLLPASMISIAVLVVAGVRPRLNEYR
ncbi:hypothetical protein AB0K60_15415 [Thermopolyspora sp. NPDC052614]|uniref:hypothetical protein n=1 Tax=Thermopolyspora sp. NPDC052614 TaxID=3155682 RepID=UPI003438246D